MPGYPLFLVHATEDGGVLVDRSNLRRPLTLIGAPSVVSRAGCIGGKAIAFNGNGQAFYAALPQIGATDFTMEAFVELKALPTADSWPAAWSSHQVVMGYGSPSGADGASLILGATKLLFQSNDAQYGAVAHGLAVGQRVHVMMSKRGTTGYLGIGGAILNSFTVPASVGGGSGMYVGCETGQGAWFNGYMEEPRIWLGQALYTGDYAVPTGPFANGAPRAIAPPARPTPTDVIDGGFHQIPLTVDELGVVGSYLVRLYDNQDGRLLRKQWSRVDGSCLFTHLANRPGRYFAVAHDHGANPNNAGISDRLPLEPMYE